ncbi:MAG: sigma-54-dependent Fis family transcriptional regulator [Desulfobacteraceae bacterium]|nr:sigma-54-dependent Fis family transcriptional regulator [Desulfobacteraceae bacterium]
MEQATILIVDDTRGALFLLKSHLEKWGYSAMTSSSGAEALNILDKNNDIDMVISDQVMPEMDGIELLRKVREIYEDIPFIVLTGHGSIDKAVVSMKQGADDYITKPYNPDELKNAIRRSLNYYRLSKENKELKNYLSDLRGFHNIITQSPHMLKAIDLAANVAESPSTTVVIHGESGTGKELMARAIHCASGCMESRFVGINCAGIPSSLIESELFGHVKGAFTGADKERRGKLGRARDGSLLLDEIGDMPQDLQAKLLRILEERAYEKVGSDQTITTNARIITATHRNLEELVKKGDFREDLFHRINSFPIVLPPLRERREDIPLLVNYFLDLFRKELGKPVLRFSKEAMTLLSEYHWPGNIRELKNCIERAAIMNTGELVKPSNLTLRRRVERSGGDQLEDDENFRFIMSFEPEKLSLDAVVNQTLEIVLKRCDNNKARAASLLKVHRNIFYRKK